MKSRKAFTLIELLVVVAIIALLIAILLPSLAKARESTKKSVCAANLKGLDAAAAMYAAQFEDQIPSFGQGGAQYWPWDVSAQTCNALLNTAVAQVGLRPESIRRWFYCPSNPTQNTQINGGTGGGTDLWTHATTDGINGFRVIGYPWLGFRVTGSGPVTMYMANQNPSMRVNPPLELHRLFNGTRNPSESELLVDGIIDEDNSHTWDSLTAGSSQIKHYTSHMEGKNPAGQNVACFDGHVEWRKWPGIAIGQPKFFYINFGTGTKPQFYWINP